MGLLAADWEHRVTPHLGKGLALLLAYELWAGG